MSGTFIHNKHNGLAYCTREDADHGGFFSLSAQASTAVEFDVNDGITTAAPLPNPVEAAQMALVDFPRNEIVVTCQNCGQVLRFRTHRLIAEYGRKEKLGDVLAVKAQACESGAQGRCELVLMDEPI